MILIGFGWTAQASPICQFYDLWQSVQVFTAPPKLPVFPKGKPHVVTEFDFEAKPSWPVFEFKPHFESTPSLPGWVDTPSVSLTPAVPEPSSLFAMAAGLAGLGLLAWRRGRKSLPA